MIYRSLLKPLLFRADAEQAHQMTLKAAQKTSRSPALRSLVSRLYNFRSPVLHQHFFGHLFRNPIGLAAGFDKNGQLVKAMEALGAGFTEIGSITAQASCGNPKPRAFRLPKDRALINRMGLNNDGAQTVVKRLQNTDYSLPLGINIAKTHDAKITGTEAIADYLFSYKEAAKVADYITVNISCPNTAAGKTFEQPSPLNDLLTTLSAANKMDRVPMLVKFSSDLNQARLTALVDVCEQHQIEGYVACNTSSGRNNLHTDAGTLRSIGKGGLSGAPLADKSRRTVQIIRQIIGPKKLIIGVGGVDSFEAALAMVQAGANLLQLYTGFIYEGPALIKSINKKLVGYLQDRELSSISGL